jgi:hypothetical protein
VRLATALEVATEEGENENEVETLKYLESFSYFRICIQFLVKNTTLSFLLLVHAVLYVARHE